VSDIKEEIYQKIKSIISEQLNIDKDSIDYNSNLEKLGADSLDMVEIAMKLEDEFKVEINDEDANKLNTIEQAVNYINNLKTKNS